MSAQEEIIPQTQKAIVYNRHEGDAILEDVPVPEIGPDDLLVKILYTGVCHTDVHVWMGDLPVKFKEFPIVGGHEGAGIVVKVGQNVKNFKLGDRAGVQWINSTCMNCEYCKKGLTQNCPNALMSGCTRDGSFQQYAAVKAANAAHIPIEVDMAIVSPILCAGVTVYVALRESGIQSGETVAITGAGGGLGSLCIQYARAMNLHVLAIDMADKEAHCRELGADLFLDPTKSQDIIADVRALTNGGPHAVINLATNSTTVDQACVYVRTRGTVVLVALPKDAKACVDVFDTVVRSITLKGSYVGNAKDIEEALDYFTRGHISVPTVVQPLSTLSEVFKNMLNGKISGRVVLDVWK